MNFYRMTAETTQKLRVAKLTAAEWRIWSYLVEIEAWGDRYRDVDTLKVLSECDVSKATYYRAIAKFQELEIFDFQDKGFSVRNLCASPSVKNEKSQKSQSQSCKKILKNETTFSKMRQNSQNCENQALEVKPRNDSGLSQTIQTNKTDQIRSEIENFDLKDQEINQEIHEEVKAIAVDPENDFKDFIIKTIERDRNIKIANREAYLSKVLAKDREQWKSLYEERNRPKAKARDVITEDIWRLEQSLNQAIRLNDLEFAIARLENIPDMAEQIYQKHPEWRSLLCG